MKKLLFAALSALVLFSCSRENDVISSGAPGEPATLKINIAGNGDSRASGSLATDNSDAKVNNYTMFFTRADGSFDRTVLVVSDGQSPQSDIAVTTALAKIYVIANANDVDMSSITNETTLKAFTVDMDKSGVSTQVFPTAADGTGANVYQKGSSSAITFDASNHATATVTLSFIPARIKVVVTENWSSANSGNTNNGNNEYVKITDILVLNAKSQSLIFGASSQMVASAPFYAGMDMTGFTNKPSNYTVKSYYSEAVPTTGNAFFYLFENSGTFTDPATTFPAIVVLKAKFYDGTSGGKDVYYPARFDNKDIAQVITPGQAFEMDFKLSGDPTSGGGATLDPAVPILGGQVTVTVTPATWNTQGVSKEFN